MATPRHYVPAISRPLVAAIYHEARRLRIPMTKLMDRLLRESLKDTPGWSIALNEWPELCGSDSPESRLRR